MPEEEIAIVIPVFNDWDPLALLLDEIDANLVRVGLKGHVVVIDDASTIAEDGRLHGRTYASIGAVEILRLAANHGHQRAIALGLVRVAQNAEGVKAVVVMDGDGEDRPDHIPHLLEELERLECSVVFATRTDRHEGALFRLMYQVYRFLYWLLLGVSVRWGNYSVMRTSALPALTTSPDLWNHYAAAVARSRLRFCKLALPRGKRYSGRTHMNYTSLVIHGLSSIAASSEVLGARMLMVLTALLAVFSTGLVCELAARTWTSLAIPNIAIAVTVTLGGLTVQGIAFTLLFMLLVLGRRAQAKFVPLRDAPAFIGSVERIATTSDKYPVYGTALSQILS